MMTNCIPKIIHYVWFGGNPLGDKEAACMESWSKYMPDFKVMRWDESTFDVTSNQYCLEAYQAKKWAFVSDYVRLWALVQYGGVYLDTDVEVLRPLDRFMSYRAFSGFESDTEVPTGIMASVKGHPFFDELLRDYDHRVFVREDGSFDTTTNVEVITQSCVAAGLRLDNSEQEVAGFHLFPKDYFCPKSHDTGVLTLTENTYTIHHFSGSWRSDVDRRLSREKHSLIRKHPWMPSSLAGVAAKLGYGFKERDFTPLFDAISRKAKGNK